MLQQPAEQVPDETHFTWQILVLYYTKPFHRFHQFLLISRLICVTFPRDRIGDASGAAGLQ